MSEYLIVCKNNPDVDSLMSGYQNAKNIHQEGGRSYYLWTNRTGDDSSNFENLRTLEVILGTLLLPAVETIKGVL